MKTNKTYLCLGSNLGNRKINIINASNYIKNRIGKIVSVSSFYKSLSWGYDSQNYFINMVISVSTYFSSQQILAIIKDIESQMGRDIKAKNAYLDRIIDIDILMVDDLVLSSEDLDIPHKLMHKRKFVLKPLNEIYPYLTHPLINKSIGDILKDCNDVAKVEKL